VNVCVHVTQMTDSFLVSRPRLDYNGLTDHVIRFVRRMTAFSNLITDNVNKVYSKMYTNIY